MINAISSAKPGSDGYVRSENGEYVGCVNPDGGVLNPDGKVIGKVFEMSYALYYSGEMMGLLTPEGSIKSGRGTVGCANLQGEVLNKDGFVVGQVMDKSQAYDLNGKFINNLSTFGYDSTEVIPNTKILLNRLIVNPKKEIKGIVLPEKNIVVDSNGKVIGHLFADGYVYNQKGIAVDRFVYDGSSFYANRPGTAFAARECGGF